MGWVQGTPLRGSVRYLWLYSFHCHLFELILDLFNFHCLDIALYQWSGHKPKYKQTNVTQSILTEYIFYKTQVYKVVINWSDPNLLLVGSIILFPINLHVAPCNVRFYTKNILIVLTSGCLFKFCAVQCISLYLITTSCQFPVHLENKSMLP